MVVIMLVEMLAHQLFPVPAGVDVTDPEDLKTLVGRMPLAAQALIVGGWVLGAAVGGFTGNLIAQRPWPALVVGALVALGAIANMAMIPHPLWMQLAGVLTPLAVGGLLFQAKRGPKPATA